MSKERYEIQKKIGEGGAGSVYIARDTRLKRDVAIKRLVSDDDGEWTDSTVEGMLDEARLLSSLDHPNIVTIYDADVDEDGPYVVMELLQGRNMDEVIAEHPMTASDFKEFAKNCLEALTAAHSINVIHRDIKPNNIVLKWFPNGKFQAKLLDFGMAKLSKGPTKQTVDHEDSVMGSIYFMAPEQFERSELDVRTDIYALGSVFYYTLTGHYPFTGETPAVVMASHLTHRVAPIADLRPDLPEWLCNWIMWLINREMQHRPESAQMALDFFLANERETPLVSTDIENAIQPAEGVIQVGQSTHTPAANALVTNTEVARPTLLTESGKLTRITSSHVTLAQENITSRPSAKPSAPALKTATATSGTVAPKNSVPTQGAQAGAAVAQPGAAAPQPVKPKLNLVPIFIVSGVALVVAGILIFTKLGNNKEIGRYNDLISQAQGDNPSPAVTSKEDLDFLTTRLMGVSSTFDNGSIMHRLLLAESDGSYDLGEELALFATQEGTAVSNKTRRDLFSVINAHQSEAAIPVLQSFSEQFQDNETVTAALMACKGGASVNDLSYFVDLLISDSAAYKRKAAEAVAMAIIKKEGQSNKIAMVLQGAIKKADNQTKQSAVTRLLGALGGKQAEGIIRKALNSGDPNMALAAISAIRSWPDTSMLQTTIDFWNTSTDQGLRRQSFNTLFTLMKRFYLKGEQKNEADVWSSLIEYANTTEEKKMILNGLVSGGQDYATPLVKKFLDEDKELATRAKKALTVIKRRAEQGGAGK